MYEGDPGTTDRLIVFFDGYCQLCNFWVSFLLKVDTRKRLTFCSLTSSTASELIRAEECPGGARDSVIFVEQGRAYYRSSALLRILKRLGGAWPLLCIVGIVPRRILDVLYDIVARNRYKWFGRRAQCRVPSPEERSRFCD